MKSVVRSCLRGLTLTVSLAGASTLSAQPGATASDLNRVRTGSRAPDFTLRSPQGEPVTLAALRGKEVVLVFYRGFW